MRLFDLQGFILAALVSICGCSSSTTEGWPRWGGDRGDFTASSTDLAESWETSSPKVLWNRELGEGYSAIVAVDGRLFTMFSRDGREFVVAVEAKTGDTVWNYGYDAPILEGMAMENGAGPHSTPCYHRGKPDRVYTVGVTGILHCLDARSGDRVWVRKCLEEFDGSVLGRGYSSNPIIYGDSILVPVGGEGHAVMAFRLDDGEVKWRSGNFGLSHSSPILTHYGGREMLAVFAHQEFTGLDPGNGAILWRRPHHVLGAHIASMPVSDGAGTIFYSTAYEGGSWALELSRAKEDSMPFQANERWFTKNLQIHHSNAIRIADLVYGPSGSFGPKIFTCIDLATGSVVWKDRGLTRCNSVRVGKDLLLTLDEEGVLALSRVSRAGLAVLGRKKLFEGRAWTPPTVLDKSVYVRNQSHIMAVELP